MATKDRKPAARIVGNRRHGYAVTINGLTVSGFPTRAAAVAWIVAVTA